MLRSHKVLRLELTNVRNFGHLDLDFRVKTSGAQLARNVTLVIGKNGTNKTTLLRTMALALCDDSDANALLAQSVGPFISRRADEATVRMEIGRDNSDETHILEKHILPSTGGEIVESVGPLPSELGIFVCGYGAGRARVGSDRGGRYRSFGGVQSLFNYDTELIDPELTVRRLQDSLGSTQHDAVLRGLTRVLDLTPEDRIVLSKGGGIELSGPTVGTGIPLHAWADGYRLTLLWLLDIYARAMAADRIDQHGDVSGVMFVDEIDQHLHPSLQARMIGHLRTLLPNMQMVLTTHSPLVALGVDPSELIVLRRIGMKVNVEDSIPDFRGYSAEDMLADDRLFDSEVYSPETAEMLGRYDDLVEKGQEGRTKGEEAELRALAGHIRAQPLPPAESKSIADVIVSVISQLRDSDT
jgi:hypothetical protein